MDFCRVWPRVSIIRSFSLHNPCAILEKWKKRLFSCVDVRILYALREILARENRPTLFRAPLSSGRPNSLNIIAVGLHPFLGHYLTINNMYHFSFWSRHNSRTGRAVDNYAESHASSLQISLSREFIFDENCAMTCPRVVGVNFLISCFMVFRTADVCVSREVVAPWNYDNKVNFHLTQTNKISWCRYTYRSSLDKIHHCF